MHEASNHSFGTAIDINSDFNAQGDTPLPIGVEGSVRELVPIFEDFGFRWGGHFNPPFQDGMLINDAPPYAAIIPTIPTVTGVTVNTVHGDTASIARLVERIGADVEMLDRDRPPFATSTAAGENDADLTATAGPAARPAGPGRTRP